MYADIIGKLVEYDRLKNAELLKTLTEMARCNFNIASAAENMYLHRNTISQRMRKISRILGIDINDPEQRLAIKITSKFLNENLL
jgi:purine catabolism regulator